MKSLKSLVLLAALTATLLPLSSMATSTYTNESIKFSFTGYMEEDYSLKTNSSGTITEQQKLKKFKVTQKDFIQKIGELTDRNFSSGAKMYINDEGGISIEDKGTVYDIPELIAEGELDDEGANSEKFTWKRTFDSDDELKTSSYKGQHRTDVEVTLRCADMLIEVRGFATEDYKYEYKASNDQVTEKDDYNIKAVGTLGTVMLPSEVVSAAVDEVEDEGPFAINGKIKSSYKAKFID